MGILCGREGCFDDRMITNKTFPDDYYSDEVGYIGLFAGDSTSSSCVNAESDLFPFEMWVWCRPSIKGLHCAQFKLLYPSNIIPGACTENDEIVAISSGSLASGISVCYSECQYEWHWSYRQTMYLTGYDSSEVVIVPHPEVGSIDFINCAVVNPNDQVWIWTNLYLNSCEYTATKKSSWGGIKSLFGK